MTRSYERETAARFAERYRTDSSEIMRRIERDVIGGDWGANGYTTLEQADGLAELLDLGAGRRLLDVGAGRGWPGLYLARRTGCDVVLVDVPMEGLRIARMRARRERMKRRTAVVRAAARHLPFARGTFDAVVHTDVLC